MINKDEKIIKLSPIEEWEIATLNAATAAGRDSIAERIKKDIDEYSLQAFVDDFRSHLGASKIGNSCDRFIWFSFRWMAKEVLKPKTARLFNRGHLEEERVVQWLRGIGMNIKQVEDDGRQIRIADVQGHFGGSCDGNAIMPDRYGALLEKVPFLLEIKTANAKGFEKFAKGVQKSQPTYWTQLCVYGFKLGLKYAIFIVVGKNDDDIEVEILELDWEHGRNFIQRAEYIINLNVPPARISENASFWECRFCPMQGVCHLKEHAEKNCRSCQFASPAPNGEWHCSNWNAIIPKEFLLKGCDSWTELPH